MKPASGPQAPAAPGGEQCLRKIDVERYLAGDLAARQHARAEDHLVACASCRERVERLRADGARLMAEAPAEALLQRVRIEAERRAGPGRTWWRAYWLVPAAAGCAIVLVMLGMALLTPEDPGVRTKGAVAIDLYLMRQQQVRPATPADRFQPGDRIQFVYSAPRQRFVFLVSLDDTGRVTNFNHRAATRSVPIEPGIGRVLEGSIILDETPHAERIFALFSEQPLEWSEVERAARLAWREATEARSGVASIQRLPLEQPQATVLLPKDQARQGP